jgi:type VI secretion system protein ImpG
MQDPAFKRRLASLYKEVQEFSSQYENTYLRSIGENPHVTRLIEAFTFLYNKLHVTLEESREELVSSLIGLMYPHLNQPIPSYMLVQLCPSKDQAKNILVPKGSLICVEYQSQKVKFQITYDHEIVPLVIQDVSYTVVEKAELHFGEAKSCMSIKLKSVGGQKISTLGLQKLRFYINKDDKTEYSIYEAIFGQMLRVVIRDSLNPQNAFTLSKAAVSKVGFAANETLLPKQNSTFAGHRLMTEFFFFPAKFLFFDLSLCDLSGVQLSDCVSCDFFFKDTSLQELVSSSTILLNVVPTINLFCAESDPVEIIDGQKDYKLLIDKLNPKQTSVYAIKGVNVGLTSGEAIELQHLTESIASKDQILWYAQYKKSLKGDSRDCYIHLVSQEQAGSKRCFYAKTECFNNDIPYKIFATFQQKVHLSFQNASLLVENIVPVSNPTSVGQICAKSDQKLELLTYLSVHYLNILDELNAKKILQNLLSIYVQERIPHVAMLVSSINKVDVVYHIDKIKTRHGYCFCRGSIFRVYFENTEQIPKGLLILFCQILDEFLAFYCPINSFIKFEGYHQKELMYSGIARESSLC